MDEKEKTAFEQPPGIKCPECGFHIYVTIITLLNNEVVICNNCGLKLSIDAEESKEGLNQLRILHAQLKKAKETNQYD